MTRPPVIFMRPDEVMCVKKAAEYAGRSDKTIRRLCQRHGIYRQTSPSAPWQISKLALEMVLNGDFASLEVLRAGNRSAPAVQKYLDHLGLPP